MLVTPVATSTNALMDTSKNRSQFVNIILANITRMYHLVFYNNFTCLLNVLTNLIASSINEMLFIRKLMPSLNVTRFEQWLVSKLKYEQLFPTHDLPWKDIYLLPRSVTLDSKMREFQYKVLSRILYTNKVLHKMGIVNSPACTFCHVSDESLEHLFLHCPISSVFWLSVTEWLKNFFTTMDL